MTVPEEGAPIARDRHRLPETVFPLRLARFLGLILDFDPTVFSDLESVRVHE